MPSRWDAEWVRRRTPLAAMARSPGGTAPSHFREDPNGIGGPSACPPYASKRHNGVRCPIMASPSNRDEFTTGTKVKLERRTTSQCSNPECRCQALAPTSGGDAFIQKGVASHIEAASPLGPRYRADMTRDERRNEANGIWLCQDCGKVVDSKPAARIPMA